MSPYNDAAANRSKRRVALAGRESAGRLDGELYQMAKAAGHHGVANFIEYARQRCKVAITPEYARELLARGGYPNPKP